MVAIRSLLLIGVAAKGLKILVSLVRIPVAPLENQAVTIKKVAAFLLLLGGLCKPEIMYTEEEEYEEYLSWRDDMDSVERYLDRIESQLDDEIERYNQSDIEH